MLVWGTFATLSAAPFAVDLGAQAHPGCPSPLLTATPAGAGAPPFRATPDGRLCQRLLLLLQSESPAPSPARVLLYSALVPGLGQRALQQSRWSPYLAVELWAWIQFLDDRRQGTDLQERYRDLAWEVARRVSTGTRVDGDFEYYERLGRFAASGAFDTDPFQPGVQPETDPSTFNGSVWMLARDIFLPPDDEGPVDEGSPAYRRAIEYYIERSYSPRFAWTWGEGGLEQAVFRDLIRNSDENLRRSTTMIGVILANHLVSAVDALISARLRRAGGEEDPVTLRLEPYGLRGRWAFRIEVAP